MFPLYLFFKNKFKIKLAIFNLATIFFTLWILKNILISGCILFPVEKTCFKTLIWSDKKEFYNQINLEGEAWAKGWPQRENKNISKQEFVKNFNWLNAWKEEQLKNFLKNLLPFILISFFIFIYIKGNSFLEKDNDREKKITILFFSSIGSIFFLLEFPLYRYGYSYLIVLINLIYIFNLNEINLEKLRKFSKYFILICLIGVTTKQIQRIYKFSDERTIIPSDRNLSFVNQNKIEKIKISNHFSYYYSVVECKYYKSPCTNYLTNGLQHKKFWKFDIIYKR